MEQHPQFRETQLTIKMTASRASRRTVTKGRMNIAYFAHHTLKALFLPLAVTGLSSRAVASLTRHFACIFDTRSLQKHKVLAIAGESSACLLSKSIQEIDKLGKERAGSPVTYKANPMMLITTEANIAKEASQ